PARVEGREIRLGPGVFDVADGLLRRLGDLELVGPRLELWRAPTDNDRGNFAAPDLGAAWREAGLHRLRHRVVDVDADETGLTVHTRVAPAAVGYGVHAVYRWSAHGETLRLVVDVEPEGDWPCPWARVGVLLALPATLGQVAWYGLGPGEAYPDSRQAARLGRYAASVDDLHTPYVHPQK